MTQNKLVEALKEHSLEVIVLSLYFIFPPAKYVATYKSWPETEHFLISISIFLLSVYFLMILVGEDRRLVMISNKFGNISNSSPYNRLYMIISHFKISIIQHCPKPSKNRITSSIKMILILSGLMTFYTLKGLQEKFIIKKSGFFWDFIINYIEYLLVILVILFIISWFIKEFEEYIKKC